MAKIIIKLLEITALILGFAALSGCYTVRLASEVGYIGIEEKRAPSHESMGAIRAKDCAIRVGGFGPGPKLMHAFDNLKRKNPKLSYLKNFRINRTQKNAVFWITDCWEIAGFGYQ